MKKEELIAKVDVFMNQARQANCYFLIIKQFIENRTKYHEEIAVSSAFYSYTYNALVVATFMELSKIYDSHPQSSNIQKLVADCKKEINYFPKSLSKIEFEQDGEKHEFTPSFQHIVKENEQDFFRVEIEQEQPFRELLGSTELPIRVDMTLERFFELYEWHMQRLEPKIKNLLKQRNKVYAHNDEATMKKSLDDVINEFALNHKEITELISFALDFCQFAYAMLTDINKATAPVNIDDWENTLRAVRLGEKYKEVDIQKQIEELKKSL
ncbi:AbiU2 domain-containing protein [Enterococcus gallinarum]|uniref:AbiU2 domain-containing protein n=1 Tax=Enterococcus gallinarum TaxID=1353 RepID=UPI0011DCA75B|nr:hypothetical protein [Enterococcus gallinarum]TXT68598.1 hypothetical protein D4N12_11190 [Enterococcus gallinarum]